MLKPFFNKTGNLFVETGYLLVASNRYSEAANDAGYRQKMAAAV